MDWRNISATQAAAILGIGGSLLAISVPAFLRNLAASKVTEPIEGLDRMVVSAVAYADAHPHEISFPPSVPLTPADVPRGVRVTDPPEIWEHLTWKCLEFSFTEPHAFSFQFTSQMEPETQIARFTATAHGDLDGDGSWSTFEVRGERLPGQNARVLPGIFIDREVE